MKSVKRTQSYLDDLNAIETRIIEQGSPQAAADLWLHIDGQVDQNARQTSSKRSVA